MCRWGEELVFHYLQQQQLLQDSQEPPPEQRGRGDRSMVVPWNSEVVWVNRSQESGLPYDIVIK